MTINVEKKIKKTIKKLFGYTELSQAVNEMKRLQGIIQLITACPIDKVTTDKIKEKNLGYEYAKYQTIKKILDIYTGVVSYNKFIIKELENEIRTGSKN